MSRPNIDKSGIERAAAEHKTACERRTAQNAVVDSKQRALVAAQAALEQAIADAAKGVSGVSPADAQRAVIGAELEVELQMRLAEAVQHHAAAAAAAHVQSEADAYLPLMKSGAAERVAACRDYQDALARLEAALQRSEEASGLISEAMAHGAKLPFLDGANLAHRVRHYAGEFPPSLHKYLRPLQEELQLWAGMAS